MKKLATLLFTLLTFAGFVFAQAAPAAKKTALETSFAPYVVGSITNAPGASIENYSIGIGAERDTKRFLFDGSGVYSTALTTANPGAGHVGLLTLQGYYKVAGHLLAGGGATAVLNTGDIKGKGFLNTAKSQANPFVGAGLEFGRFRTIASYQLPSRGAGVPEQIKFNLNSEFAVTRHIRVGVPLVISSYQTAPLKSLGGVRATIAQAGVSAKFVF